MIVWVLIAYIGIYQGGGPLVIDNISDRESCLRLASTIAGGHNAPGRPYLKGPIQCIAVRKVRP